MATLDSRIEDDLKFFDVLFPLVHGEAPEIVKEYNRKNLALKGEIQIETMLENAIESVGGPKKLSKFGMDFKDGSDAKKSCARTRAHGTSYDGSVVGIQKKIGTLRVMLYERKQDKFYYFKIPNSSYDGMKYIEIPFTMNGEPKRRNRWWSHEVSSFVEMAT